MKLGVGVGLVVAGWLGSGAARAEPEGRIFIARSAKSSGAEATFAKTSWSDAAIGSAGPCAIYKDLPSPGLDAGTIAITGTTEPITLEQTAKQNGVVYRPTSDVPNPVYADGATITVASSGGADIPAFTATVTAPTAVVGFEPPTSVSRTGYTATWSPNAGAGMMLVLVAGSRHSHDRAGIVCHVDDTGTFTLPLPVFAFIPPSADRVSVTVARVAETVQTVGNARVVIDVVDSSKPSNVELSPPAAATPTPVRAPANTTPSKFASLSFFAIDRLSGVGEVPSIEAVSIQLELGQRLAHGLHLVERVTVLQGPDYFTALGADASEAYVTFAAGVRWTPFEPRPRRTRSGWMPFPGSYGDVRALCLTEVIGADGRDRVTTLPAGSWTESLRWAPMASLALSWLLIQGRDWAFGPELRGQLAYFDHQVQTGWALGWAFELRE